MSATLYISRIPFHIKKLLYECFLMRKQKRGENAFYFLKNCSWPFLHVFLAQIFDICEKVKEIPE